MAEYLEQEVLQLRAWRSNETIMSCNMDETVSKKKYLLMFYECLQPTIYLLW